MPVSVAPYEASTTNKAVSAASNALLEIPFVDFTTKLIHETLQSCLDVTLDQMEAYAELVAAVSKSLDKYTEDTFGTDEDYIRSFLKELVAITPPDTGAITEVKVEDEAKYNELALFFNGILVDDKDFSTTFPKPATFPLTINAGGTPNLDTFKKFVKAKMTEQAAFSQDRLIALLKLGMQKLVIDKGEICTKLLFHVDSKEFDEATGSAHQNTFSEKITSWGATKPSLLPGKGNALPISNLGRRVFGRTMIGSIGASVSSGKTQSNLNVKVVNEKSTAAVNLSIDIVGSVKIEFHTDYFPSFIPENNTP